MIKILFVLGMLISLVGSAAEEQLGPNDTFDSICGSVMEKAKSISDSDPMATKLSYCKAAKSSKSSITPQKAMFGVWTAVASICMASCIASFIPPGFSNAYACSALTLGASIGDAVQTKNFMMLATSIASAGGGLLANRVGSSMGAGTSSSAGNIAGKLGFTTGQKDIGSCLSAVNAGVQAWMKSSGMKSAKKSYEDNLKLAKAEHSGSGQAVQAPDVGSRSAATEGSTSGITGDGSSGTGGADFSSAESASSDACTNTSTGAAIIQCAIASDSTIPSGIMDPRFANDFNKISGSSLGDFLNKDFSTPSEGVGDGLAGLLPSELDAMAQQAFDGLLPLAEAEGMSTYQGGGGSRGPAAADPNSDMAQLMAGLLEKLGPKADGEPGNDQRGLAQVIFANQHRSPTAIAEDKTLNLFDRITFRYYFTSKRMFSGGNL